MIKLIILFLALILTTAIYLIGISEDNKRAIDKIKNQFEYRVKVTDSNDTEEYIIFTEEDIVPTEEDEIQQDTSDEVQSDTQDQQDSEPDNPPESEDEKKTEVQQNDNYYNNIYEDMKDLYYGRLYIPDLNINVALYYGSKQYITDRVDSANIYMVLHRDCLTIADHNHQAFANLPNVQVGMMGYIQKGHEGSIRTDIQCIDICYGQNIKDFITDMNGEYIAPDCFYMMYTCKDDSNNVFICLWNEVKI